MFYALAKGLIDTGELRFEHVLADIETLNQAAFDGTYEVTAVSVHAYAHLDERYALLGSGASMGDGYGPVLIAKDPSAAERLGELTVAVPGRLTSAALALQLWNPTLTTVILPFDRIMPAVEAGEVDAGVVIHEGQLTWSDEGFSKIVDLGVWWAGETGGLPLPLGGNVIRRDLGDATCRRAAALLKASIEYSLAHRDEALDYALDYGRGLDRDKADCFVGMYVNQLTVDYGDRGRQAVQAFLERALERGLIARMPRLDFL
jgi:1,4-dihydroxy-6-naphthoate synthase